MFRLSNTYIQHIHIRTLKKTTNMPLPNVPSIEGSSDPPSTFLPSRISVSQPLRAVVLAARRYDSSLTAFYWAGLTP